MGYYEPLTRFLEGRSADEIVLTFRELESIIGRALPPSARKHQAWWANTTSHSHAEAWLRLNWKTSKVDLSAERVAFANHEGGRSAKPAREPERPGHGLLDRDGAFVAVNIDLFSVAARRLLSDYAAETNGDLSAALARAVHEAAKARRARIIDDIVAKAPRRLIGAENVDSLTLLHEGRDERDVG